MIRLSDEPYSVSYAPTLQERLSNGLFILDKPIGPTSHEAAAFVRKILGIKKAGHSGTLDFNVSGVLPVLLGEGTKAARYLLGSRKKYVCIMRLNQTKGEREVREAMSHFHGRIFQKPPLESAVARKLRIREVFQLKFLEIEGKDVLFECDVEGGFYVRKLCTDLGEVLGCGGSMFELRRVYAAGFSEKEAHTLQDLSDAFWLWKEKGNEKELDKILLGLENSLGKNMKRVVAKSSVLKRITMGGNLGIDGIIALDEDIAQGESVQVLNDQGKLVCFAKALLNTKDLISLHKSGALKLAFDIERVVHG